MAEKTTKTAKAVNKTEKHEKNESVARAAKTAARGRIFQGEVIKKFPMRVVIELERTVKIRKFERFMKKKTRIHARLPDAVANDIRVGDLIRVQECRPLSKIIHFIVIEKVRSKEAAA